MCSCLNLHLVALLLPGGPFRQQATGVCGRWRMELAMELEPKLLQSLVWGKGASMVAVPGEDGEERAALHQAAET